MSLWRTNGSLLTPTSAVDARTVTRQVLRTARKRDESTCIDGMFSQE
jgi:hypothetical protein